MTDNHYLSKGTLLCNNSYRIESVLGQGGFGITYLAIHTRLKIKVAIKEFFPKGFCDREDTQTDLRTVSKSQEPIVEKLKKKFIKEAEHIAQMDSSYIVKVKDICEENNTAYYIMDYIEGMTLSDMVKANGPLSEKAAIDYISKIGNALSYIHSKKINHLDVKPANIMVRTADNTPILLDFGLSKQYDSDGNQTSTTPVGLSHGYAPLEQYKNGGVKEFSPQTDLYSLAATLYFLLTGKIPPQAPRLIDEDLTFPSKFPKRLIPVIKKAMSPKRADRQTSVKAFCDQLTAPKAPKKVVDESTVIELKSVKTTAPRKPRTVKKVKERVTLPSGPDLSNPIFTPRPRVEIPVDSNQNQKNSVKFIKAILFVFAALALGFGVYYFATNGFKDKSYTTDDFETTDSAVAAPEEASVSEVDEGGAPLSVGEKKDGM